MRIETLEELTKTETDECLYISPKMEFVANPNTYYLSISANIRKLHPIQKVKRLEVDSTMSYPEFENVYEDGLKRAYYTDPEDVAEHFVETIYGEETTIGDPVAVFTTEIEAVVYFYKEFEKTLESFKRLETTLGRITDDIENSPFIIDSRDKYPEEWI